MMKVYLDNCSYNRPFDDQGQIRIYLETQANGILKKYKAGEIKVCSPIEFINIWEDFL